MWGKMSNVFKFAKGLVIFFILVAVGSIISLTLNSMANNELIALYGLLDTMLAKGFENMVRFLD